MTRKDILLRAAYDLLARSLEQSFMPATYIITFYDGANCDGYCLMQDIADVLGLEEGTRPIALDEEDEG